MREREGMGHKGERGRRREVEEKEGGEGQTHEGKGQGKTI